MSALDSFHPAVRAWFQRRFAAPTGAQEQGWPHIFSGRDTLITAPTGSGKTLAAFLVAIDRLLRQAEQAPLADEVAVVYVSPLKALSNDIQRNLEEPLAEIAQVMREMGRPAPEIRTMLRTGDTTQAERQQIIKRPPHILITTPESLYLMLTAERSRQVLRTAQTVIVDEVHALIRDKRGSHLALSLARLDHICAQRPVRVGLSATVKPLADAARFLVGADHLLPGGGPDCEIVDAGHQRDLELAIEAPPTDLQAVASAEQWKDTYDRLAELIRRHRTTLVFVNTRRLAERAAFHLAERIGEEHVGSHHGSLSKERRLTLERRLKAGEMKALVATASLELGIDIGAVDLVCQLESPRSITTFLQRVGRSGHALGLTPKGCLFPTTRDELIECAALVRAVRAGRLDRLYPPVAPLDILAQQIVAEVACEPWTEDALYALLRKAWPYAGLPREAFDEIVELVSEGIAVGTGRVAAYVHRDRINGVLRARRGARSTAIQCGGAIPEVADFRVIAEPEGTFVGTLDEDFSIESMAGDIILLGTTSWRIRRIEPGVVRVESAHGAPPSIPFWNGEAPGRTLELSEEVSRLRMDVAERLEPTANGGSGFSLTNGGGARGAQTPHPSDIAAWLQAECALPPEAAEQVIRYVRAERDAIGVVPSQHDIVFERFFDEAGGMQLVVHAPFGGRINRAWGLALRKRFCVGFDFELQAAASDDAMLLSIGPQNSFPLDDMFGLVRSQWVDEAVEQSLLISPMFAARWRWNATRALAILRQRNGKRVPPQIQRMKADDLMAAVFPRLVACQENVTGPIEIPDHPLVRQTVHDCLHEAMDIDGLRDVLTRIEAGAIRLHARDTTEPSPFAHEMVNSKPYTYLDNAPLEERRARAVVLRRTLPEDARDLGVLDADAIERVAAEARPDPRDAEELHDTLLGLVAVRPEDFPEWEPLFADLAAQGRAAIAVAEAGRLWFAAESLPAIRCLFPGARIRPPLRLPPELDRDAGEDEARLALLRGHMEYLGPVTAAELGQRTGAGEGPANSGLARLEGEGAVLRGRFRPAAAGEEWCDRRLLARIHRYTLDRLRREIEPVSLQDFLRFLLRWQHVAPGAQLEGKRGLLEAIAQLQGFDVPAVAWERHILPARVAAYKVSWLDELCLSGDVAWARLAARRNGDSARAAASSATPVSLARRADLPWLIAGLRPSPGGSGSGPASSARPPLNPGGSGSGPASSAHPPLNPGGSGSGPASSAHPPLNPGASGFSLTSPQPPARGAGRDILDLLQERGALFFDDIVAGCGRLSTDVERGLWELVARGLVTADGFQALRSLIGSAKRRHFRQPHRARLFRTLVTAGTPSGRWSLLPPELGVTPGPARPDALVGLDMTLRPARPEALVGRAGDTAAMTAEELAEAWAEQLLFRYGVIFRDLLQRENVTAPWRDMLRCLRRLEARGEVRGGRFVAAVYGEQYARPEAVESLRKVRRTEKQGQLVRVSAVDPLNLVGILTPGPRLPAVHTKSVLYRDGLPLGEEEARAALAPSRDLARAG
ncbi:MAG: DEAD/DEAH box helicase [Dehalococcoidia bacterium]|nr:DEAD/DEAH box helicase [Dehalococcoidia bacterium]